MEDVYRFMCLESWTVIWTSGAASGSISQGLLVSHRLYASIVLLCWLPSWTHICILCFLEKYGFLEGKDHVSVVLFPPLFFLLFFTVSSIAYNSVWHRVGLCNYLLLGALSPRVPFNGLTWIPGSLRTCLCDLGHEPSLTCLVSNQAYFCPGAGDWINFLRPIGEPIQKLEAFIMDSGRQC